MPNKLKGTKLTYSYNGKLLNIEYQKTNKISSVILNGEEITSVHNNNKYRYFLKGSDEFFNDHFEDGNIAAGFSFEYPVLSSTNY